MKAAKALKNSKKKASKGTNVRINEVVHGRLKSFCEERGYKLGAFMESASLKRMLFEIETA